MLAAVFAGLCKDYVCVKRIKKAEIATDFSLWEAVFAFKK
jgi:hypothetical protein